MNTPLARDSTAAPDNLFVSEADWIPGFWNYLLDLDRHDLIAELVQNDLDQDATRTVVSFDEDQLVCEGNGNAVDPEGWRRLRKIQGAGDAVPAKRGMIGVKNHGLKTAFTVGDELRLTSAGHAIVQTLYARGPTKPPYPGASPAPFLDPLAPPSGCRIAIRYRRAPVEPPHGEANVLGAITAQDIDALFLAACANAPQQFAGIVSPELVPRYEIILRHHRLGEARLVFSCTRRRRIPKRIDLFRRRCTVSGTASPLPSGVLEQAARRLVPLRGRLSQRVADFFRRQRSFFVEVSWPIDPRGRPTIGTGRFRYPIGYPNTSHEARTGHSAHFNAPFASDNKRHGPARNEATNSELRADCEALLLDALACYAIPSFGPYGLNPLVPRSGTENEDTAIRPLLTALTTRGAMPVLTWLAAVERVLRGTHRVKAVAQQMFRRRSLDKRRYRFIVPVTTSEPRALHPSLCMLSPRSELQLDPRIHCEVLRLLTDRKTPGFGTTFVTFDERDVFDRLTSDGNSYFGGLNEPEREFGEPLMAHYCFDLIGLALDGEMYDGSDESALLGSVLAPCVRREATLLSQLYSGISLPSDVPGLRLPPILHATLVSHPLFRRKRWRLPPYTVAQFIDSGSLDTTNDANRRAFWGWLCRNKRRVAPTIRPKLARLAIWPDADDILRPISDLCEPRSARIAAILADAIRRPHPEVRRSKLLSTDRARLSIRQAPTADEIANWIDLQLKKFNVGATADGNAVRQLYRFETDIAILLKDPVIAGALKTVDATLPALAKDGTIQTRTTLVMPSRGNDRLALPDRFVLKSQRRATTLNVLSPVLHAPTASMVLDAFVDSPTNFVALQPRLHRLLSDTTPGADERLRLAQMPIVPVDGEPRTPSSLAFIGNRGDYWGAWKSPLSPRGMSQDEQRRCREVGVTSALPTEQTSRAFFEWLAAQGTVVVERHMPCVMRQILHPTGPTHWADSFTETPFIPAGGRDGIRLLSLRAARTRPVYLPDAGDIGEAVGGGDGGVLLVVDSVREVREPVTGRLRSLGVKSLREALREPERVTGSGDVVPVHNGILDRLRALRSSRLQQALLKRLNVLGVDSVLVRRDWHDRLSWITGTSVAADVQATYRFRGKIYRVAVDAGFDPHTRIFWMRRDGDLAIHRLYEALAQQLVFKPTARPIDFLSLERALTLEILDPSFGRLTHPGSGPSDQAAPADDVQQEAADEQDDAPNEPTEAIHGHSPFEPDARRNAPKPRPLPSTSTPAPRGASRAGHGPSPSEAPVFTPTPELEKQQVEALKRDQYASHCQMCLCALPTHKLAPVDSYVEWEEVRRHVIEAHHVDLKSAGGARHAGNLILLCKLHHDNYGRRLARTAVTAALRDNARPTVVHFQADSPVAGERITLVIPDSGDVVELFFTDEHAAYWLSAAPQSS